MIIDIEVVSCVEDESVVKLIDVSLLSFDIVVNGGVVLVIVVGIDWTFILIGITK